VYEDCLFLFFYFTGHGIRNEKKEVEMRFYKEREGGWG